MPITHITKRLYTEQKQPLILIAAAVILLVISLFFDNAVRVFMKNMQNPYMTYFFTWISNTIVLFFLLGIVLVVLVCLAKRKQQLASLLLIFLLILVVTAVLKVIVARSRPLDIAVALSFFDYSFPSQHTAFAVAAALYVWRKLPALKYYYTALAILVAISRIYLQAHYLSDVIAGALIGYIVAWFMIEFQKKWQKEW